MRTDDFIDALAITQASRQRPGPTAIMAAAVVLATLAAVLLTYASLGFRAESASGAAAVWLKLVTTGSIVFAAGTAALRASLPGQNWSSARRMLIVIGAGVIVWAFADLTRRPVDTWASCIAGRDWSTCLIAIPLLALVPMLILAIAMRYLAPTRLREAGALLGLASGAIGAMAFSLYCRDDAASFITVWYALAMAICASIGSVIGPKILRW